MAVLDLTHSSGSRRLVVLRWLTIPALLAALLVASVGTARGDTATLTFPDFTNPADDFQLNGDTQYLNPNLDNVLRLTNSYGQAGSAFLKDAISLDNAASFSTAFKFEIHNSQSGGADGLVFVVQTVSNTAGGGGGGIGYKGIENSVGIEFDTWNNGFGEGACDDDANHVGINLNGSICSEPRVNVNSLGTMDAGGIWYVWVDYNGTSDVLEVRVARTETRPALPLLTKNVDLVQVLGQTDAYIGFTSGTGGAMSWHDILAWQFTDDFDPIIDPIPEPTTPPDADGDGVPNNNDDFPISNADLTVVIGGCDSGVENTFVNNGANFNDLIGAAAVGATNHGDFVSKVSKLADDWKKGGLISGQEKGRITSCAARSDIP